jgi:DNA-binding MarR family transcriptional regulator
MTAPRLSRLQKRMLCWLSADERRTRGVIASSHQELVQAMPSAKGNISHSLRRLETQGLIRIGRSPGGLAEYVTLTMRGRQKASQIE